MGRYINYAELMLRYPSLADYAKNDETTVESFIIGVAEAELDGRLGIGFSTPFTLSLPIVKNLTFDLCFVKIMFTSDKKKADEVYTSVKETIKDLLEGKIVLSDGSTVVSPSGGIWVNNEDQHPVHSMLGTDKSFVSSERLAYEEDERT